MEADRRTVLITGASSGIGRACVIRMAQAGWHVFATVRKQSDQDALLAKRFSNIDPILMDVTDASSITAAAAHIDGTLQGLGLDRLVNVAGIGMVRPIEYATMRDIRDIFEINFFGQIAVIQAFSRLLRTARGRIVNITSVGVNLAIPFGGLLNSSKSAFAMLNDTLRLEMRPFGVYVCAIEPGAIATPAVEKTLGNLEQVMRNLPAEAQAQYGAMIRHFGRRGYEMEKNGSPPEVVAEAVHHALTSSRPRIRYRVGKHAKLLAFLPKVVPERILDSLRISMLGANHSGTAASERQSKSKRPQARKVTPSRPAAVNPK